jgi:tryptophan-rich sensory protein
MIGRFAISLLARMRFSSINEVRREAPRLGAVRWTALYILPLCSRYIVIQLKSVQFKVRYVSILYKLEVVIYL